MYIFPVHFGNLAEIFNTQKLLGKIFSRSQRARLVRPSRTIPLLAQSGKVGPRGGRSFLQIWYRSIRLDELSSTVPFAASNSVK